MAVTAQDLVPDGLPTSLSGAYLAGRSADKAHDISAAATYYGAALADDYDNPALLERVLVLRLAAGEIDAAQSLAERLVAADDRNPIARLVLATEAIKGGDYEKAKTGLARSAQAPLAALTGGLLGAWADFALGHADAALAAVDSLSGPSWYGIFKDFHHAAIADAAGRSDDAVAAIRRAYNTDKTALRVVESYARILARAGKSDEAIQALETYIATQPLNPVIRDLLADLKAGKKPAPIAATAQQGAAEVLYGLGSAIGTDEGTELPAAYLQSAHYLDPDAFLPLIALGDVFQSANQCDEALAVYGRVPASSPLIRNADIQSGLCLDSIGKTDEGAAHIKRVTDSDPSDLEAIMALGAVYRAHDRFAEAADVYSKGIATIADKAKADWRIFYFRGVSLERSKRWDEAEADFKQALAIDPNQPQVLNYLGYSWVDKGIHLDEALKMIQAAVDRRPNDGYIVDSLGWAYFRLGRLDDAVDQLERAVELKPEDSVINDHLGDALWKAGRKREATFQWAHARDLDPEPEERAKIVKKLESGMPANGGSDG
ncbi:MAG TPA: tetratricopeptide repeat protein [Bauldia sp.]|nr:tetratricopeptide repeat protein [Bauldia sp.]